MPGLSGGDYAGYEYIMSYIIITVPYLRVHIYPVTILLYSVWPRFAFDNTVSVYQTRTLAHYAFANVTIPDALAVVFLQLSAWSADTEYWYISETYFASYM